VHRTDPVAVDYWETWITQHPEHGTTVDDAARIVRGIPFASHRLSSQQVHRAWLSLQSRLSDDHQAHVLGGPPVRKSKWLRVAAAVVVLVVGGALAWWGVTPRPGKVVYTTAYGETQAVLLPDGSEVTLNAHSRVTYLAAKSPVARREVWIEGEAFFRVVHLAHPTPVPFVVHTPDLRVQVLGTQFNVNTRRHRTRVVLNEGRVELQLPSDETTALRPGELAEYDTQAAQVRKEAVDTELFTAWRDRRLKFDDTPLSEVALVLEENYGVRVIFDSPALREKRVTGEISASELQTILRALSTLFDMTIEQSGDTIRIAQPYISP
jgi:ferric-dicitrate binding protein FerR (iron transport regulator)